MTFSNAKDKDPVTYGATEDDTASKSSKQSIVVGGTNLVVRKSARKSKTGFELYDIAAPEDMTNRGCTDSVCCFLFVVYIVMLAAMIIFCVDHNNLFRPHDKFGMACAEDEMLWNHQCIKDAYKRSADDETESGSFTGNEASDAESEAGGIIDGAAVKLKAFVLQNGTEDDFYESPAAESQPKVKGVKTMVGEQLIQFGAGIREGAEHLVDDIEHAIVGAVSGSRCPYFDSDDPRNSDDVYIMRKTKGPDGKIINIRQPLQKATFVSRYVSHLRRCLRVEVRKTKYCAPRVDRCFSMEDQPMRFRGCCPQRAARETLGGTAIAQRDRDWLLQDVKCYYKNAYNQYLPVSDDLLKKLDEAGVDANAYENAIVKSEKNKGNENQLEAFVWLVSNRDRMLYRNNFQKSLSTVATYGGLWSRAGLGPDGSSVKKRSNDYKFANYAPNLEFSKPYFQKPKQENYCEQIVLDGGQVEATVDPSSQNILMQVTSRYGFQMLDLFQLNTKTIIFFGIVFPIILGVGALLVIPYCFRILVWFIYGVTICFVIGVNFLMLMKSGWMPDCVLDLMDGDPDGFVGRIPTATPTTPDFSSGNMFIYSPNTADYWRKWAVVSIVGGVAVLILLYILKKRISLGLELLHTVGIVMLQFPGIIWFALLAIFFDLVLLIAVGIPLFAVWGMETDEVKGIALVRYICDLNVELLQGSESLEADLCAEKIHWGMFAGVLMGFFWLMFFFAALLKISSALCVSKWYFERHDPNSKVYDLENDRACFRAFMVLGIVCCKHLGTAAFGSFLIAVLCTIQTVIYLMRKAKSTAGKAITVATNGPMQDSEENGGCFKKFFCSLHACLSLTQWALDYITGEAYVYVAIEGKGFCRSAHSVAKLILEHPLQLGVNEFLNRLLYVLILVVIPVSTYVSSFVFHNANIYTWDLKNVCSSSRGAVVASELIADDLGHALRSMCYQMEIFGEEGFTVPTVCAILAIILNWSMCSVYATCTSALFVCVLRDKTQFDGVYMQHGGCFKELQKLMDADDDSSSSESEDSDDKKSDKRRISTTQGGVSLV